MNPEGMNPEEKKEFDEMRKRKGLAIAVCIYEEKLPRSFFDSLSFKQWKDIEHEAYSSPVYCKKSLAKRAFRGMLDTANTFEQWDTVRLVAKRRGDKQYELKALLEMHKKSDGLDEHFRVYASAPKGSPLRKGSLEKIARLLKPYM